MARKARPPSLIELMQKRETTSAGEMQVYYKVGWRMTDSHAIRRVADEPPLSRTSATDLRLFVFSQVGRFSGWTIMPSKYATCQVRLELSRKHFQIATFDAHNNTAIMAQIISNSGHDDMIHDAVLDYYGRRLATCSSDKTIKIFEIEGDQHRLTETLKG